MACGLRMSLLDILCPPETLRRELPPSVRRGSLNMREGNLVWERRVTEDKEGNMSKRLILKELSRYKIGTYADIIYRNALLYSDEEAFKYGSQGETFTVSN